MERKPEGNRKRLVIRNIILGEGIPAICCPVSDPFIGKYGETVRKITDAEPDLLEIRADMLARAEEDLIRTENIRKDSISEDNKSSVAGTVVAFLRTAREQFGNLPLLFTWRTSDEGGSCSGADPFYGDIVKAAVDDGTADLIDIERRRPEREELVRIAKDSRIPVILSEHHFQNTPDTGYMTETLLAMEKEGADIAKIAVMPHSEEDVIRVRKASEEAGRFLSIPRIVIAMGILGQSTRTEAEAMGSCLTFGTAGEGSAPGQISVSELRQLLLAFHRVFI